MSIKKTIIALSLSSIFITACGSGSNSSSKTIEPEPIGFNYDATELITNLTNDVIVVGYQALDDKAQVFHLATLSLLNNPTQENLLAAQIAWQEVRVPWEQGEAHIFGPVDALSIDPHLDTWPLNTSDLQALLTTQSGFSADELMTWNDDVQGFHTMEYLLFGDGIESNEKLIEQLTVLEQEYLVACAEVFKGYTHSLYTAWTVSLDPNDSSTTPYKDLLLTADNDVYASQLGVIEELINGMIGIVDEVGNGKIADPFATSISTADTSLVESQYSWNSLADFSNNIKGVQNVYRGEFSEQADKTGLIDFVHAANATIATRIDDEISAAIIAINTIAGDNNTPFRQAILDEQGRERIQLAIDSLSVLQTSLENDVLPLLNEWNH
ncbi:imelysin family protein [Colwelliaceae bacterium 6441]